MPTVTARLQLFNDTYRSAMDVLVANYSVGFWVSLFSHGAAWAMALAR